MHPKASMTEINFFCNSLGICVSNDKSISGFALGKGWVSVCKYGYTQMPCNVRCFNTVIVTVKKMQRAETSTKDNYHNWKCWGMKTTNVLQQLVHANRFLADLMSVDSPWLIVMFLSSSLVYHKRLKYFNLNKRAIIVFFFKPTKNIDLDPWKWIWELFHCLNMN